MMMENEKLPTRMELALGAFLRDIGRFSQCAGERDGDFPSQIFKVAGLPAGIDWRRVRDCATEHQGSSQDNAPQAGTFLAGLLAEADCIAAGIEREGRDQRHDPDCRSELQSLVTMVRLTDQCTGASSGSVSTQYHPVCALGPTTLHPVPADPAGQAERYKALWRTFGEAYRVMAMRATHSGSAEAYVSGLASLAERFMWAIPAAHEPDVGAYDHARIRAAAAAALYAHHEARGELGEPAVLRDRNRSKFRMVTGDLSGIQRALFVLASQGATGLARLLRGRSLRFQLITEVVARRLLAEFGMPEFNLILNAGSKFTLLVPYTDEQEQRERLDRLRFGIDGWMRAQYAGDLVLNLSMTDGIAPCELFGAGARSAIQKSIQAAERAKLDPLAGAREPVSDMPFDPDLGICRSCGRRPASREDSTQTDSPRCRACGAEERLGRRFAKATAIVLESGKEDDRILDCAVGLPQKGGGDGVPAGWRLRDAPDEAVPQDGLPLAERFAAAYVPRHDAKTLADPRLARVREEDENGPPEHSDLLTFAELAELSIVNGKGRPMLACLKADVDRLGQIFNKGFGERYSLARTAALSRMMDRFFTGRLPWLLKTQHRFIYTVYAGGDDLLLLGPWHDVFRFARTLREEFATFAGANPAVTLSAGLALFDPATPVSRAAHEAEERLSAAKEEGRNRISAIAPGRMGVMTWDQYSSALEQSEKLVGWLQTLDSGVTTALLYRMLELDRERMKCLAGDHRAAGWRAKLGYSLGRAFPRKRREGEAYSFLLGLFGLNEECKPSGDQPDVTAKIALSIALYRQR